MTTDLHRARLDAVEAEIVRAGARSVIDLGCGGGDMLLRLAARPGIGRLLGVDLSAAALAEAGRRLAAAGLGHRATLVRASLLEPAPAWAGFDMAILVETIEHLPPDRLSVLERALFERLRPRAALITTPNADFNPLLGAPAHRFRHPDHRFEWGRARFAAWARGVARRRGLGLRLGDLGGAHPELGGPSQMALFAAPDCAGPR